MLEIEDLQKLISESPSGDEMEVEDIIGHRTVSGQIEYLIKWTGYGPIWNSWEPVNHLQSCAALIEAFHQRQKPQSTKGSIRKADMTSKLYGGLNHNDLPEKTERENLQTSNRASDRIKSPPRRDVIEKFEAMLNLCGDATVFYENEVDNELPPAHFQSISEPLFRMGVPKPDPSFLVGCVCGVDGCKSGACLCIAQNRDECPMYIDGRVVDRPGPIYECNVKCNCPPSCSNRVVQNGRLVPLTVARYGGIKGWGVKAVSLIPSGTFIDVYLGEVITAGESIRRSHNNLQPAASAYLFDLDFYYANGVESEYTIDAYAFGNVTRFINHSCKPNLRVHPCFIETWNPSLHHLAFFAKRDILAGEELSFDYLGENAGEPMRKTNNNNGTAKPKLSCSCGAPTCRGFVY